MPFVTVYYIGSRLTACYEGGFNLHFAISDLTFSQYDYPVQLYVTKRNAVTIKIS